MEKIETTRVNFNMPSEVLKRLDQYAFDMNINRTSAMVVLLNQALDQTSVIKEMPNILDALKNANNQPKK